MSCDLAQISKEKMGTSTIHYASLTEELGGKNGEQMRQW